MQNDHDATYTPPTWKHHMNVEYIEINFTGLQKDEDIIQCVSEAVDMAMPRPDKTVRALVFLKYSTTSPNAIRSIKKLGKKVQPKLKRSAVVGSVGIVSLLMKIYISYTGSKIRFFTDKETAIKYLIND